jgi:hypothetical protein
MERAVDADTSGFTFPGGATTSWPLSSSTRTTKRAATTDEIDGSFDPARWWESVAQEVKVTITTTAAMARSKRGNGRTSPVCPRHGVRLWQWRQL